MIDLIKRPYLTDKSLSLIEKHKYAFEVDAKLTKSEIKDTIQKIFDVKVKKVNTYIPPRKKKKVGGFSGTKRRHKRALVSLHKGDYIDIF